MSAAAADGTGAGAANGAGRMIDLRSDTVTRPTEAMRAAMAAAPVGDDCYGDDPTVLELERRTAEILGKEAAMYVPTGTMSNQLALRAHTEPGDTVLIGPGAHIWFGEGGAPSPISGVVIRPLEGDRGMFDAATLRAALNLDMGTVRARMQSPVRLVCAENTHNGAGGAVWPLDLLREMLAAAREAGLATHLDGARLWNATAASGIPEAEFAVGFDTVNVCFSKALGAPLGSALAGPADLIERARRFKQLYGGGFRQAGIVAAGALYALEHHRERLTRDHARARRLARGLAAIRGLEVDVEGVETNIVRFRTTAVDAPEFAGRCREAGVLLNAYNRRDLRVIPHLHTTDGDVADALEVFRRAAA
ncbi:threonine aldolase family protein [Candidatus Palauibacter sp.]|uniref:threonine aldolase family protein n=1 Tax=Candidatus Palauibacter sp. TaxID=3101350 RepID=UPI003B0160C4